MHGHGYVARIYNGTGKIKGKSKTLKNLLSVSYMPPNRGETEIEKCGFSEFGIKISLFGHISSNLYKIYPYILTRVLSIDRHE